MCRASAAILSIAPCRRAARGALIASSGSARQTLLIGVQAGASILVRIELIGARHHDDERLAAGDAAPGVVPRTITALSPIDPPMKPF
jgi:hypothetical protein